MEINRRNILSPDEIEALIAANPNDPEAIFDLVDSVQEGRVSLDFLESLHGAEADRELAMIIQLGSIAEKGADIHRPMAA